MQLNLLLDAPDAIAPPAPVTVPPQPDAAAVRARLVALGLPCDTRVVLTRNLVTMLSWSRRTGLRLHAGYASAPDAILAAIVRYIGHRGSAAERAGARRIFMAFPAADHVPSRLPRWRPPRVPAGDQPLVARLQAAHRELNLRHFDGALEEVPILVSHLMRRKLGVLSVSRSRGLITIGISARHVRRDGWNAALETLLHEMVHQWQAETGRPVDHRRDFRDKARAVGIQPRAKAR